MKDSIYFIHEPGCQTDHYSQHLKVLEISEELEEFDVIVEDVKCEQDEAIDYQQLLSTLHGAEKVVLFLSNDFFANFETNLFLRHSFELALGKGLKNFIFVSVESLTNRHSWDEHKLGIEINLEDKFIFDFSNAEEKTRLWKSFCSQLEYKTVTEVEKPRDRQNFDVFLSHSWQQNGHKKVLDISKILIKEGLTTWIDEEQIRKSITQDVFDGVKLSKKFVVFLTKPYLDACVDRTTQIGRELRIALSHIHQDIILVCLDKRVLDINRWPWVLKQTVAENSFFDFTTDSMKALNFEEFISRALH